MMKSYGAPQVVANELVYVYGKIEEMIFLKNHHELSGSRYSINEYKLRFNTCTVLAKLILSFSI